MIMLVITIKLVEVVKVTEVIFFPIFQGIG